MSAKIDGSNGISYPDGTTQVTANIGALRNLIINGDMRVAQRGVSAALTAAAAYPSLDRWVANQATSANGILAQVAAGLIGFQYAAKLGRNSGATQIGAIWLSQSLESINSIPLQGQTVTLSFYAKAGANFSAASSTISANIYTGTGTDQTALNPGGWTNAGNIGNNAVLTTSWQRFTFTTTLSSAITQLGIGFGWAPTGTAGADDNVYITGVQLERGQTASLFEVLPAQTQIAQCQRYYTATGYNATLPSAGVGAVSYASIGLPVNLRTYTPICTESGVGSSNVSSVNYVISGGYNNFQAQLTSSVAAGNILTRSATLGINAEL